jgi:hypothetical protein
LHPNAHLIQTRGTPITEPCRRLSRARTFLAILPRGRGSDDNACSYPSCYTSGSCRLSSDQGIARIGRVEDANRRLVRVCIRSRGERRESAVVFCRACRSRRFLPTPDADTVPCDDTRAPEPLSARAERQPIKRCM